MRNDSTICPMDQAKMEFFHFIKAPDGRDLYDIFNIYDQPSESLWDHYANWWASSKIEWDNQFNPSDRLDNSWVRFVVWSSKMFMSVYQTVFMKMALNPSLLNGEELLWCITFMKNMVLDLKLAHKLDADTPKTWFQRMVNLPKEIESCNGDLIRVHKVITELLPNLHRPVQFQLVRKEDLNAFKNHNINQISSASNLVIPPMRNIEDQYRIKFGVDINDFNKKVEKVIKEPNQDDLFGEGSTSEDVEVVEEEPPKKKKKKVIFSISVNVFFLTLKIKAIKVTKKEAKKRKAKKKYAVSTTESSSSSSTDVSSSD